MVLKCDDGVIVCNDGALLVAHLDAGFAEITKVRASRLRVTAEGILPGDGDPIG